MDILNLSIKELSEKIKNQSLSAESVASFYLKRAKELNPQLNAYLHFSEQAIEQASQVDKKIKAGLPTGALAGVPIGVKDMFCIKEMPTTAASKMLAHFISPYDATVIENLKKQDAIILGKLNQDEFAMGSSGETSYFGVSKNPWSVEHTCGGSSGGSAAAQAAGMAALTLGTDTGGSIRQPANFCGVVGVKPTYGRVSRYGIIAYASSLDQAGPLANSVEDAALALELMAGHDSKDATSSNREVPSFSKDLNGNLKGLKIGFLKEFLVGGLNPEVEQAFQQTLDKLKSEGAQLQEVSVPLTKVAVSIYYLIASAEASSNLSRYDGVRYGYRAPFPSLANLDLEEFYGRTRSEGFGEEVKRRILLGTYCLSSGYYDAYYKKASQVRRLLTQEFLSSFTKCDVIVSPVTTAPAFKIGEKINDPMAMYLNDAFTTSANLAGLPAMSLPIAISTSGLPIGLQIMAKHFDEQTMLNTAKGIETLVSFKGKKPHGI
ncbi:MAG: Asp-tRNA(Asn)/Glu-tRNA(Gln) amidotransferase subunit GatA [Bdellovibrionia bacterium]